MQCGLKKRKDRHTDQCMERNKHDVKNDLERARKKGGILFLYATSCTGEEGEKKVFVAACRRAWINVLVYNIQQNIVVVCPSSLCIIND